MLQLKKMLGDAAVFNGEVLNWIAEENLWNIWVPKQYGGLELSFTEGLKKLQSLARLDGSLGWTITLCSGANYFIGNLQPETTEEIFAEPAIFGGSGGMFGTAEKLGGNYKLNGTWRYATGAPYLTHFTLNARIIENGKEQTNDDGSPKFLSFVIPANQVSIIEDWNTMGLKASATHSFEVKNVLVDERHSFVYNTFYLEQPVFKIHFSVFADLTLWVNYIGMAEHLLEEASLPDKPAWKDLEQAIYSANEKAYDFAKHIETLTGKEEVIPETLINEIHQTSVDSVRELSKAVIALYPHLGVKGSRENHTLNQIFRDYFTATQHHIFTK
ncbi:acyl-CoA dehydrogenase [Owenweeksia hongkongensis]|uniref:acyl-CoA dehydrogenase n=1 Tax=Owenweeksia hongkongensis TaxID=253245 RepID=UPI003A956A92